MKKIIFGVLFFIGFASISFSQTIFEKDTAFYFFSADLHAHGSRFETPATVNSSGWGYSATVEPSFTYYFYKHYGVGAKFSYEFFGGHPSKRDNFKKAGVFFKAVSPFSVAGCIRFFIAPGFYRTNYTFSNRAVSSYEHKGIVYEEMFKTTGKLNNSLISVPLGIGINVKRFHLELAYDFSFPQNGTVDLGMVFSAGCSFMPHK